MLEKCKNTMTYSYIEYESPLSRHCWGRGFSSFQDCFSAGSSCFRLSAAFIVSIAVNRSFKPA